MFAKQYSHRLPSSYDMEIIRQRAAQRGPLWDATEGLGFKAFVVRERGRYGASANVYSAVYLWLDAARTADFFMGSRFQNVIDDFGRPEVETWLPLDARKGPAQQAQTLYREEQPIGEHDDRVELRAAYAAQNRRIAEQDDTVAVVSALDIANWRLIRLTLSSATPAGTAGRTVYEVLHLARPGIASLA
ncbi:DUF4865 family protein [Paraburkholderia sp. IMGN_8]|uniref:DUF4865 family protein n=1 Tax=Paraburkholderia sp. IMGN_8 TaxID=3136564 RepID=UPI0031018A9A